MCGHDQHPQLGPQERDLLLTCPSDWISREAGELLAACEKLFHEAAAFAQYALVAIEHTVDPHPMQADLDGSGTLDPLEIAHLVHQYHKVNPHLLPMHPVSSGPHPDATPGPQSPPPAVTRTDPLSPTHTSWFKTNLLSAFGN